MLGHYDTVYASGTLAKMPFRVIGGKAYGPGTFDMKAGIVQALFALEALQKFGRSLQKRVVFLWTSDEEIGSDASRKVIESEAKRSDAVFVLEPAFGARGLLKTERKGVGEAEIIAHGRASHAGLAPEQGVNAIEELAQQISRIHGWRDLGRGTTVAACIIDGGTRTNVIPERARAVLDLRALKISDMRRLEQRLRALCPILPGARLEIRGGFSRATAGTRSEFRSFCSRQIIGGSDRIRTRRMFRRWRFRWQLHRCIGCSHARRARSCRRRRSLHSRTCRSCEACLNAQHCWQRC